MTISRIHRLLILLLLSGCVAAPVYRGSESLNFDGSTFKNSLPVDQGPLDLLRLGWVFLTRAEDWPKFIDTPLGTVPQQRLTEGISVTYINHASTLLQIDGVNILTDPVFSERASPVSFAGPKRVHDPGIRLTDLPPIDLILISHNHYDHLEVSTLLELSRTQKVPPVILAGLGNSALFEKLDLRNHMDMQWNDQTEVKNLRITFTESRHRSGRGLIDQMKTLWGAFVVEGASGNVYFAGDTGYWAHFKDAKEQFGSFELAILPIGAYEPRWFMRSIHMNPADAVQAHIDLNSGQSMGMHFGTFQLTLEAIDAPRKDLELALEEKGIDKKEFWTIAPGQSKRIK